MGNKVFYKSKRFFGFTIATISLWVGYAYTQPSMDGTMIYFTKTGYIIMCGCVMFGILLALYGGVVAKDTMKLK